MPLWNTLGYYHHTHVMRRWISLAFAPSLVRNFMTALNSIFWLSIFAYGYRLMGIGFQTKSKSRKCTCWLNGCYHSTDKGLHCTKMKKRNLELYRKIPSSTNLIELPSYKYFTFIPLEMLIQENLSLLKQGLLLKERICSLWEQILTSKSSPYFRSKTRENVSRFFPGCA